jgi:Cyclin-dependent kinase inhibitor 3 (CDKN3)
MISYPISGPWPGKLAIVPRPRGGDWLDDELRAIKQEGFDILVSLLTKEELEELGLAQEENISQANGIKYLTLPIPDLGVPESFETAQDFLDELYRSLRDGKRMAVHCRQGIGRSGLIASSLLVMSGIDPAKAFRTVSAARGFSVPETVAQRDWVIEFSHAVAEPVAQR